jgi:hypothetical protein
MGDAGKEERKFYTFDQLIRQRAVVEDQTPLLLIQKVDMESQNLN